MRTALPPRLTCPGRLVEEGRVGACKIAAQVA